MNHDIHVKLTLGVVTGARAEWRNKHVERLEQHIDIEGKVIGEKYSVTGTVVIQPGTGDPNTGAVMGHELKHANNMAAHGAEGEQAGEEGEKQARAVENSIRQDYQDDCDDLCRGSADEALRGTGGAGAGHSKPSGFEELDQYVAGADAEKKRLEKEGRW